MIRKTERWIVPVLCEKDVDLKVWCDFVQRAHILYVEFDVNMNASFCVG
jgi:hypothetical protein